MLKLQFNLRHQDIYLVNRGEVVATDSKNYLVAKFNQLTDDWETPLTAIFTDDKHQQPYAVIVGANSELEENECFVPWEVLTDECNVYVSVYCGNLHTTVTAAFKVRKSGYIDGETPPPPSPTVYTTIIQALQDLDSGKQDKLTAGTNITIDANGVISATGGVTDYKDLLNKPRINQYEIKDQIFLYSLNFKLEEAVFDDQTTLYIDLNRDHVFCYTNNRGSFFSIYNNKRSEYMQVSQEQYEHLPIQEDGVVFRFVDDKDPDTFLNLKLYWIYFPENEGSIYLKTAIIDTQHVPYYKGPWRKVGYTLTEQDKQDIADIVIQRLQGGD